MRIFVSAEFDSVDLADLASGRVRNIDGLIGAEVLPNRLSGNAGSDNGRIVPTIAPSGTVPVTGGLPGAIPFFIAPFDGSSRNSFEPSERRDALLRVEVVNDRAAQQASSVLRGAGGRKIKIIHR